MNFLNSKKIYAKEVSIIYALQAGAFENYENALNYSKDLPSKIIINENNLYKIYVGTYTNIDVVNKMLVYFENNNIHVYLKELKVDRDIYNSISKYEQFLINSDNKLLYDNVNQSILNLYIESNNND